MRSRKSLTVPVDGKTSFNRGTFTVRGQHTWQVPASNPTLGNGKWSPTAVSIVP